MKNLHVTQYTGLFTGVTQKRVSASSLETVGSTKKTSTPNTSDRNTKTKTTNLDLTEGKTLVPNTCDQSSPWWSYQGPQPTAFSSAANRAISNSQDMSPTNTTELVKHVGSHRKARLIALETRQGNEGKCRNWIVCIMRYTYYMHIPEYITSHAKRICTK